MTNKLEKLRAEKKPYKDKYMCFYLNGKQPYSEVEALNNICDKIDEIIDKFNNIEERISKIENASNEASQKTIELPKPNQGEIVIKGGKTMKIIEIEKEYCLKQGIPMIYDNLYIDDNGNIYHKVESNSVNEKRLMDRFISIKDKND
jgi:uncharacterized protein YqgV (UPF0045/DUF77 family)